MYASVQSELTVRISRSGHVIINGAEEQESQARSKRDSNWRHVSTSGDLLLLFPFLILNNLADFSCILNDASVMRCYLAVYTVLALDSKTPTMLVYATCSKTQCT